MDKLKKLSDAELIKLLREQGIPHGPVVDSTRTLYEKKLIEYERKKKTGSAESSYESKQQYSTREYDANQGALISAGEMAVGVQHNQQSEMELLELAKKLASTPCSDMLGVGETGQKVGARGRRKKVGTSETIQKVGARKAIQKVGTRKIKQKVGARKAIQKVGTRETRQKIAIREIVVQEVTKNMDVRVTRQKKVVGETGQQAPPANPMPDLSATASIVLGTQEPEVLVASLSTPSPKRAKYSSPSTERLHEPKLTDALNSEMQSEENPNYFLAMSLVPLLDKVPEDKKVALRHDLLNVISSYYPGAAPKPLWRRGAAPPPASAQH